MKQIFLVRHGKSSWKDMKLDDFDRPLNGRGKKDVPFMAKLLAEDNILPDLIISSPAKRTLSTAKIISAAVGYSADKIKQDERIYEADVRDILTVINEVPEDIKILMLIGHNPSLTSISNYISDKRIDNIPTSGIVNIELNVKKWKDVDFDNGKVLSFDYPKKYIEV